MSHHNMEAIKRATLRKVIGSANGASLKMLFGKIKFTSGGKCSSIYLQGRVLHYDVFSNALTFIPPQLFKLACLIDYHPMH